MSRVAKAPVAIPAGVAEQQICQQHTNKLSKF